MLKMHLTRLIAAVLSITVIALGNDPAQQASADNAAGYTHVPVNVSFVPNVGTGGLAGGNTVSNFSLNVIGGSIGTLHGVEFGSIVNIERKDVIGAQWAGIVNIVGNNTSGVQFAGISNITGHKTNGVQYAGITNITGHEANGVQYAGINNIAGNNSSVCQFAGVSNIIGNSNALQMAGVSNIARDINGAQICGVVNIAKKVNGVQIGVINIAEDINGVPIGLFNYVKSVGLHYQLYIDEIGMTNVAIRSGSKHVYSLLTLGVQINNDFAGSYGWGMGGRIPVNEKLFITTDLLAQVLYTKELWHESSRFVGRIRAGASWQIKPRFALIGGVSVNTYLSKVDEGDMLPKYIPNAEKDGKRWQRVWPGAYLGMEF